MRLITILAFIFAGMVSCTAVLGHWADVSAREDAIEHAKLPCHAPLNPGESSGGPYADSQGNVWEPVYTDGVGYARRAQVRGWDRAIPKDCEQ